MAFLVAAIIILLTIFTGTMLAFGFTQLSQAVVDNQNLIEQNKKKFNETLTMGYKIPVQSGVDKQIDIAVDLAAKRAASLPPGGNVRIGSLGAEQLKSNSKDLSNDPVSAVKIAQYHGWEGAKTGPVEAKPASAVAVATGPQKMRKVKLSRGKDYAYTAISAGMSGPERRNVHIANGKSIMAAYKALKESGADMVAETAAVAAAVTTAPSATSTAASAGIAPPDLIEITEDMAPADVRKARISNAKANSAYKKALKAAGIDPTAAPPAAVAAPVVEAAPAPVSVDTAGIAPPDLIEITEDMAPADVRKARISNAKANSAYKKALKAAGIDPATVG